MPQNSAHNPVKVAGRVSIWLLLALNHVLLVWVGITSTLPANRGIQKLWMTSSLSSFTTTDVSTGTRNSLAVVIVFPPPASGYSNSHHHWCPVAVTSRIYSSELGGSFISNSAMTDQIPNPMIRMVGMMVQAISRGRFPCTWAGLGWPGRRR